jgi:deazaflavin-dependent oxidoreductase (nitroreductase family)
MDDAKPTVPRIASALNRRMGANSGPAFILHAHRWLYEHTDGRLGHGMIGAPTLLLYTTGRRSGLRRTTALVYGSDGDIYVVAASNDGADHNPAWLYNVRANPHVKVRVARRVLVGEARVVESEQADYARLWALMNRTNHSRYDHYQAKTTRPIPLVAVTLTAP